MLRKRWIVLLLLAAAGAARAEMPDHPFLLWTPEEAAALRKRIESDPMAKKQYENMKNTEIAKVNPTLWNLFNYMVMGDEKAGQAEKERLLKFIGTKPQPMTWDVDLDKLKWNEGMPSGGDRHMRDEQTLNTLRYDVLYHELTAEQRAGVEASLRSYIEFHLAGHKPWHPAFKYDRTSWLPNMHWPRAIGTHLMAVALRDKDLVEKMFRSQGGWKWFFDEYIADEQFYMEEFGKYYSNIGTMLMYCEGLERLGLGQYGYGYVGQGGATMKKYLQMLITVAYPRIEKGRAATPTYMSLTMGDAGDILLVHGYNQKGKTSQKWWSTAHMNGPLPKMRQPGWFEIGHRRWPDVGFDYFLAQMRKPGDELYLPSLYWGLSPIDPDKVQPPSVESVVSEERGFALLKAEHSPKYWESDAPAVGLQFAMYYVHYVHDCFSILQYVANNRLVYHRMGRPEGRKGYAGGDPWKDHVRGHCGVVVDGLKAQPVDRGNAGTPNHRIRKELTGPARFTAVRAAGVYPDVEMERALVLTDEYLFDAFALVSSRPRVYDWQVLAFGALAEGDARGFKPLAEWSDAAEKKRLTKPHLFDTQVLEAGSKGFSVVIARGEENGLEPTGVRVSMLPGEQTHVLASRPPRIKSGEGTSLLVTRNAKETTFLALHEPFKGKAGDAPETSFQRVAGDGNVMAISIKVPDGPEDLILLALGDAAGKQTKLQVGADSFSFTDYALIRREKGDRKDTIRLSGSISALDMGVPGPAEVTFHGKRVSLLPGKGRIRLNGLGAGSAD
ncbi:MAG: hypothetical protein ACLFUJ_10235 [Phycisphaerae bacterium]